MTSANGTKNMVDQKKKKNRIILFVLDLFFTGWILTSPWEGETTRALIWKPHQSCRPNTWAFWKMTFDACCICVIQMIPECFLCQRQMFYIKSPKIFQVFIQKESTFQTKGDWVLVTPRCLSAGASHPAALPINCPPLPPKKQRWALLQEDKTHLWWAQQHRVLINNFS